MAKSFVMQLASLVTLFVSIPALVTLVFSIINIQFPDAVDSYWQIESAESAIRYSIAVLVVFFPAYLWLTRRVNQARRSEGQLYHTLTKWLIYLALLVAGLVILGDLAVVVYTFLGGEITVRFILKALALIAIIGPVAYYYALDAKDFWQSREKQSIMIGIGALVAVLALAVLGYLNISSPSEAREVRLDQEQIYDLQDMQWRVENYYQMNNSLPTTIEDVYTDFPVPTPAEGREEYQYNVTGNDSYELCATFLHPTSMGERQVPKPIRIDGDAYFQNQNWEHGAGLKCFERRVEISGSV
ncbi:MAG: DUF5671 domain-containing protein [Candidatus Paceibacterota bacterium]